MMGAAYPQPPEGCVWERLSEDSWVVVNGNYLLLRCRQDPLQVYRQAAPGKWVHPCVSRMEYRQQVYTLAWVEDDEC